METSVTFKQKDLHDETIKSLTIALTNVKHLSSKYLTDNAVWLLLHVRNTLTFYAYQTHCKQCICVKSEVANMFF